MIIHCNDRGSLFKFPDLHDILAFLKETELQHCPKPDYTQKQLDIAHSMHTIFVDWLIEFCKKYRLPYETLFLAISYINRYLSYMSAVRAKLQLVGSDSIFAAVKYITDDIYS